MLIQCENCGGNADATRNVIDVARAFVTHLQSEDVDDLDAYLKRCRELEDELAEALQSVPE